MNAIIKIKTLHFEIKEDRIRLYIEINSNEPDHPTWGNGVKFKDFPVMPIVEIIQQNIADGPIEDILAWPYAKNFPFFVSVDPSILGECGMSQGL